MNQKNRNYFDRQVEWVLGRFPKEILNILRETPLHVEDQPSKDLMQDLGIADAEELCGCFYGVPYTEASVFSTDILMPNSITIFRRGIVAESRNEYGKVSRRRLRIQIRTTILHEIAHLHGMQEGDIIARGYG